ncbi:MAG: SDR family oxidoreductase [Alphaproteobacteria bacterium]|nr:SDR family oxidoreductase [Alphaproteobacteria bacterium]
MRRIFITGSSSGIGAAAARRLAGPGSAFAIHARANLDGARAVADELIAKGARASVVQGDLEEPGRARALVGAAADALGGLDVLVANAGFADRTRLDDLDTARFLRSIQVIETAFLELVQAARPLLAAASEPRIVAVGSFVAHSFRTDAPVFLASAAAKGGLEAMVRALAVELAPQAITVNAVVPGAIEKDRGTHSAMTPEQWRTTVARIPLARLGKPTDVAAAIAFLASAEAGYITGQMLHVNGGLIM